MSRLQFVAVLLGCMVALGRWTAAGDPQPAPDAEQVTESKSDPFTRIRQLIQAGEHLEAAGALDLAREARAQAQRLLVQEGARLEREQKQLEELSGDLEPTQIMVQALIVEARRLPDDFVVRVIRQRGGELIRPDSATDGAPSAALLAEGQSGTEELGSLAETAHIDILSRPQVIALDGTPAQIQIGQQVPIVTGFTISGFGTAVPTHTAEEAGVSLTITPTTVADGRIRLELEVEQTRFSESDVPGLETTSPLPGAVKEVLRAQTTFTVPEGRTLLFPVNHIEDAANAESALLLLLQPRVVKRGE